MAIQAAHGGGEYDRRALLERRGCALLERRGCAVYYNFHPGETRHLGSAGHAWPIDNKTMTSITIYHNPKCSTSRNVLAMIRERGYEPTIIEYLKTPPSRDTLAKLLADAGLSARDLLRAKEALYGELNLADSAWTDDQLLDFIGQHPVLMNRPIVVTSHGTRLCRPAEIVQEILPPSQP